MTDVVVTVPKRLWEEWLAEGDLPGSTWSGFDSHFLIGSRPKIMPGERVYIVALDKVRGYAPLVMIEDRCALDTNRMCLLRRGEAVATTVNCYDVAGCAYGGPEHPAIIRGFQGWRYRWWRLYQEIPFPNWRTP